MPDPSDQKSTAEDLSKKESLLTGRERMLNQAEQGFFKKATELNKKEDLINNLNQHGIKSSDDLRQMLNSITPTENEPITEEETMIEEQEDQIQNIGDLQETLNEKLEEITEKVDQVTGPAIRKERIANLKTYFDEELKSLDKKIPYSANTYKLDPNGVIQQYTECLVNEKELSIKDYLSRYNHDIENIAKLGGILTNEEEPNTSSDLSLDNIKAASPKASGKEVERDLTKMSEEEKDQYFIDKAMKKK